MSNQSPVKKDKYKYSSVAKNDIYYPVMNAKDRINIKSHFHDKIQYLAYYGYYFSDIKATAVTTQAYEFQNKQLQITIEQMKDQLTNYSKEREELIDKIRKLYDEVAHSSTRDTAAKSVKLEYAMTQLIESDKKHNEEIYLRDTLVAKLKEYITKFSERSAENQRYVLELEEKERQKSSEVYQARALIDKEKANAAALQKIIQQKEEFLTRMKGESADVQQRFESFKQQAEAETQQLRQIASERQELITQQFQRIAALEYQIQDLKGKIRICVRVRPTKNEKIQFSYPDQLSYRKQLHYLTQNVKNVTGADANKLYQTEFDRVFTVYDSQTVVFNEFRPLVRQVFSGFKTAIFAYGQSGSGKTHTQFGFESEPGIMPRCLREVFEAAEELAGAEITVQFFEIYNDKLFDLLGDQTADNLRQSAVEYKPFEPQQCRVQIINEDVNIIGLNSVRISSIDEALDLITVSQARRKTSATVLNDISSRSHAVFQIHIKMSVNGEIVVGSLTLVDLAGSEQIYNADVDKRRKEESIFINKSLSCLGNVFLNLKNGGHVPYRDSTLTKVLYEYFYGNNKVIMIACLNEDSECYQESVNTINFAYRVKGVGLKK